MSLRKIKRAEKKGTESVMDEKFALLFWSEFSVGGGGSGGGGNGGASASGGGGGGGAAAAEFTHQVNYGIQAAVLILYTESFFEALKLEAFSVIGVSCGETRCFAACQFSPAPFYFLLAIQGLLPVPPCGRHRARKPGKDVNPNSLDKSHKVMQLLFQTGAPRVGHHPLGQRFRRVGQAALPGARQGSLEPPRCDAKHKVQGVLREGALRGQPKVPRREGIQVGGNEK